MLSYVLKEEWRSILRSLRHFLINLPPGTWIGSRCVRPWIARSFGMRCGKKVALNKCTYHGDIQNISLGDHTLIQDETCFLCSGKITIGSNAAVSFRTVLLTGTHEMGSGEARAGEVVREDIVIGDGVWIGAGAVICPGVTIGAGCVVAAGAVVTSSFPPNTLVGGVPAKVIKKIDPDEQG